MKESITERRSLPMMREIPHSGPAKANARFATLRGRSQTEVPLETVPELQPREVDPGIRGESAKDPTGTDTVPSSNLLANTRSLRAPPRLGPLRGNGFHFVAAELTKESLLATSHTPSIGSMSGRDYPENTACMGAGPRLGHDSPKPNSPQTTHDVVLQSYRIARYNGAGNVWEWGPTTATGGTRVQTPIDCYSRDASHPSVTNLEPVSQKDSHNTAPPANTRNPPPGSAQAVYPYYVVPTTMHGTTQPDTPYPEAPHEPNSYLRPPSAPSENAHRIYPSLGPRSATPSTLRLKSLVRKTSQLFGMSNASPLTTALNSSATSIIPQVEQPSKSLIKKTSQFFGLSNASHSTIATAIPEVKQANQYKKKKAKKAWEAKGEVKIVTVQTQAQMFLKIARKAERKGQTVYFASTTGSTFVLTSDSCAGAYTSISLSTANLVGQIVPSLMGAAELPPVGGKLGKKGLLFLLSPQQIMGLLPFEKVDVEKEGKSEMHGFGVKAKLGQEYCQHEWEGGKDCRFTLTLHLAMVKVRGPGQLVGEISAVFWA